MSLFEATTVTAMGMTCAFGIEIPAIGPFVRVIIVLLIVAALSALLLLPAIYSFMVTSNLGLTGGMTAMVRTAGLHTQSQNSNIDVLETRISYTQTDDAW